MYNIYSYEKKQKELMKAQKEKVQDEKIKQTRQKHINELAKNYDKRIKSFIYDMVSSPVKVKQFDGQDINFTSRKLYQDEIKKKVRLNHSSTQFIFKRFQTDRERIANHLRNNSTHYIPLEKTEKQSESSKNLKKISYQQPSMRFTYRTDLERIYDTINSNQLGRIPKGIIDQQLALLELNKPKVSQTEPEDVEVFSKLKEILESRKVNIAQIKKENKTETQAKRSRRKLVDNSQAKKILQEYHVKTHFKAASMFSLNLIDEEGNSTTKRRRTNGNLNLFSFINQNENKSQDGDNHTDWAESFYDLDYNPLLKKKVIQCDKSQLDYLKKISKPSSLKPKEFQSSKKIGFIEALKERRNALSTLKTNPITFFQNYSPDSRVPLIKPEEEKVVIGNQVFYKSEVDKISKLVLKNCNFIHNKSEFNNTRLKIGEGRTMITNGMTINEFSKKFHLPK